MYRKDVTGNKRAMMRLRLAAERAKRTLSSALETPVEVDSFLDGIDFSVNLTRAKLEDLNRDLFGKVSTEQQLFSTGAASFVISALLAAKAAVAFSNSAGRSFSMLRREQRNHCLASTFWIPCSPAGTGAGGKVPG